MLKKQDVLLHHPYQSFLPVIDFIRTTANDPNVIAIKQTVYRTGTDSELMEILVEAARKGKEVTVVVELMARFDEEINMNWAARLEEVGAHVVYGVVGHKTHAKMSLIVRREDGEHGKLLRRYAHLGTGNYHPATARQYTDFGLFTSHEELCADVAEVFQQLTGLGRAGRLKHVWQSPFTLHRRIVGAIRNEAKLAAEGKPARIIAKMNALLEPQIIEELYTASGAGVKIDLIVRGVCALRPGIEGVSLPPHRAVLPGARSGPQEARDPRGPAALSRGQHPGLGDGPGWQLRAPAPAARRQAPLGAGRAPAAARHAELRASPTGLRDSATGT